MPGLLSSHLLSEAPRVWYAALDGPTTLEVSMANLRRFQRRVAEERLEALVVDYRSAGLLMLPGEMDALSRRFGWMLPEGFRIAYVTSRRNRKFAAFMTRHLAGEGLTARDFSAWADAAAFAGCPGLADPAPSSGDIVRI